MAQLTTQDYSALRDIIYRGGSTSKAALKALATLPNKTALRAAFQAIEDRYTADRANYKAALDAALGVTTSPALAKEFERIWHAWWAEKNR